MNECLYGLKNSKENISVEKPCYGRNLTYRLWYAFTIYDCLLGEQDLRPVAAGQAEVLPLWDKEPWRNQLHKRMELPGTVFILFLEWRVQMKLRKLSREKKSFYVRNIFSVFFICLSQYIGFRTVLSGITYLLRQIHNQAVGKHIF